MLILLLSGSRPGDICSMRRIINLSSKVWRKMEKGKIMRTVPVNAPSMHPTRTEKTAKRKIQNSVGFYIHTPLFCIGCRNSSPWGNESGSYIALGVGFSFAVVCHFIHSGIMSVRISSSMKISLPRR